MDQGDYAVLATVGIVAWALGASGLIILCAGLGWASAIICNADIGIFGNDLLSI